MSSERVEDLLRDLHWRDHLHIEKLGPNDGEIFVLVDVVLDQGAERRFTAADISGNADKTLISDGIYHTIDDVLQTRRNVNFLLRLWWVGERVDRLAFAVLKAEPAAFVRRQFNSLAD